MSWSALASNQCVSCNNLQDAVNTSVFVLKNTIPVSTKQITVAEAENYVYIAPIQGKASNELVVKSNLVAGYTYSFSYASTSALACANNDPITIISNTNPIGVGSILSTADGAQAPYPYFYSDGSNWYYADGNGSEQTIVQSTAACGSVNTAVVFMNSFVDYPYGYQTSAEACTLGGVTGYSISVYYTGTLGNGTILYFSPSLTNVFDADGSFGWYWISGYSFQYSGSIYNYGACPTSFTINWDNNFISTGTNNLQILKNGSLVVDQNGQGNGSFSVVSTDLITYGLFSTTPNFTKAIVSVNTFGPDSRDDCNFNSAYASNTGGFYFSANGTIDGITIDYIDGCP
jgi:hypothetical protein